MAEKTVLNVVRFLEERLEQNGLNIGQIIVFGSRVNGTAREDSDIDIVIVSEDFRGKNILQRVKMTGQAEVLTIREFLVPLDIITLTPEELKSETSSVAEYARHGQMIKPQRSARSAGSKAKAVR